MTEKEKLSKEGINALTGPYRWMIIWFIIFIITAGRLDILQAWIYFFICLAGNIVNTIVTLKFMRNLYNQRGGKQEGTKKWDYVFLLVYFGTILIVVPIITGLDVGRYQWSSLGLPFMYLGIILYVLSFGLVLWAMLVNQHFEGTVRIQKERDHKVIMTGPYKIIRHPGYAGIIISSFSAPFIVGSLFSLIPTFILIISIIIRTSLEDKMLRTELEGYLEYTKKTKYRLFPGIW